MMQIPIKIVYDLLSESEPFKDYDIYMIDVPEDFQKVEKLPIIRITEINSYQDSFASNLPTSMVATVQVDIWDKSIQNLNAVYFEIDKLMAVNGWACILSGIDSDKDFNNTKRVYKRYRNAQQINFA